MGYRIIRVDSQFFADIFGEGVKYFEVYEEFLPKDAKLVGAEFEFRTNMLALKFESAEWEELRPGNSIINVEPRIRIPWSESPFPFIQCRQYSRI